MRLRLLFAVQLAWVALAGALCRGLVPETIAGWVEQVVFPTTPFVLFGFPALVVLAVRRERWPERRCWSVGSLQAALTFAFLLAVLPAVQ